MPSLQANLPPGPLTRMLSAISSQPTAKNKSSQKRKAKSRATPPSADLSPRPSLLKERGGITKITRHESPMFGARASCPRIAGNPSTLASSAHCFSSIRNHISINGAKASRSGLRGQDALAPGEPSPRPLGESCQLSAVSSQLKAKSEKPKPGSKTKGKIKGPSLPRRPLSPALSPKGKRGKGQVSRAGH